MQLGILGLGRMGANMARRLLRARHQVVVWNRDATKAKDLEKEGAVAASSVEDLVRRLDPPRHAWVMLPAGAVTEATVSRLGELLEAGDVVIDGGNTWFKDDVRRARMLRARRIDYCDCGTSGGVWGLERGYCLMVGGPKPAVTRLDPVLKALAPGRGDIPRTPGRERLGGTAEEGYLHCGPAGAGHFVKMVHNGIEYGVMQAYAEGFDILRNAAKESLPEDERFALDLADVSELWRRGSVIGSWLLDLTAAAFADSPDLAGFSGYVQDSGEGRWTVQAAIDEDVPAEVITAALFARFRSRVEHTFAERVLSAMRKGFGGHVESPKKG
ncbi:MAG TPA: decarboxylating 6-phosphogluconate dehydrogenase [Myxococcota bacterium]|nr:decarboxylating 6-phosphogluconate dehydrogenase [Myxococcota bacterium]